MCQLWMTFGFIFSLKHEILPFELEQNVFDVLFQTYNFLVFQYDQFWFETICSYFYTNVSIKYI